MNDRRRSRRICGIGRYIRRVVMSDMMMRIIAIGIRVHEAGRVHRAGRMLLMLVLVIGLMS